MAQQVDQEASWKDYVLTPRSTRAYPLAVVESGGDVEFADGIVGDAQVGMRLRYPVGGDVPYVVVDLGSASVGGYTVFRVRSRRGTPIVRIAYSCFRGACGERGGFERGSCTYLGVELPVLPANPGRFELYTIPRLGVYIAPLLQGQQRWARIQLDSVDTDVTIDSFCVENREVHDLSPQSGWFLCDDERINRAWYASTWTLQLASFPNHNAWTALRGWLMPRKLEQSSDMGLSREGRAWADYALEFDVEIRRNPYAPSHAGWVFRGQDSANACIGRLDLEGCFTLLLRQSGVDTVLKRVPQAVTIVDGQRLHVRVQLTGSRIVTEVDGRIVDDSTQDVFAAGRVGFCQPKEAWALFADVRVTAADGRVLLADRFAGGLGQWDFARTPSFVADGAKRDRLIWSGDLDWAGRNVYYAFANTSYMRDSVSMLAHNQTPEGYVQACPYPEHTGALASGDYGPFPSDEFSAWFVPVAWDYVLFTGDRVTLEAVYTPAVRSLNYLLGYVEADGLFHQRVETSKHAENLDLGDVGTRSYMNILLWDGLVKGAAMARELGCEEDAVRFNSRAQALAAAINEHLWSDTQRRFDLSREDDRLGHAAGALALATGFVTAEQARDMVPRLGYIGHGKFQSLMIRGKLEYGYDRAAMADFFEHNWPKIAEQTDVPSTVTECMHFPHGGWGDESHPDTAIAHLFSGYVLGIQPTAPGYRRFRVKPHPVPPLTWAQGSAPTPLGAIASAWRLEGNRFVWTVDLPVGGVASLEIPTGDAAAFRVTLDDHEIRRADGGRTIPSGAAGIEETAGRVVLREVSPGRHTVVLTVVEGHFRESGRVASTTMSLSGHEGVTALARSSHESADWGLSRLLDGVTTSVPGSKGYSSEGNTTAAADEWIQLDLQSDTVLKSLVLHPRTDTVAVDGAMAGFPCEFEVALKADGGAWMTVHRHESGEPVPSLPQVIDLYTVAGYPTARFVRIHASRLGAPAMDEPAVYRLQLAEIEINRED